MGFAVWGLYKGSELVRSGYNAIYSDEIAAQAVSSRDLSDIGIIEWPHGDLEKCIAGIEGKSKDNRIGNWSGGSE
jgi:hypothetical protein